MKRKYFGVLIKMRFEICPFSDLKLEFFRRFSDIPLISV